MDKIFSPIKERALLFVENQGIKKDKFYSETSISPSNFKGLGAKSELGGDKIVKILTSYPLLNPNWLLKGEGEMILNDEAVEYGIRTSSKVGIPLIPYNALAGCNEFDLQIMNYEVEHYFQIPVMKEKAEFVFKLEGESMTPTYEDGVYLACKKIELTEFRWEKPYLISVAHAPMVKRLLPSTTSDNILCRSDNERYRDFEIKRNDLNGVYKILASVFIE